MSLAGDVVRIQPNHLCFNSLKAIEDIHSIKAKMSKGALYDNVLRPPRIPQNVFTATYLLPPHFADQQGQDTTCDFTPDHWPNYEWNCHEPIRACSQEISKTIFEEARGSG
jgi:hypothetical protein